MWSNGETVVWERLDRSGGYDVYNRPVDVYADLVELVNVAVAIGNSGDRFDRFTPNRVEADATLYLTSDPGVGNKDRFTVRGAVYEVVGVPGGWRNPFTGWSPGVTVELRRVEG